MKTTIAILCLCAGTTWAQSGADRVNVPLSNPSRPARIRVHLLTGSITIRGGNDSREVVVDAHGQPAGMHAERPVPPQAQGMHRIDGSGIGGIDITEENNVVQIKSSPWGSSAGMTITVPRQSSVEVRTVGGGDVDVENVSGEIDADALNGKVTLRNVSGSVLAHSLNGPIFASLQQVDPSKPMSFSTLNGDIDVTLPSSVRANVRMKTDHGEIYSDFDVKLSSTPATVSSDRNRDREDRDNGKYRFRMDRTLHGTINGGGPEYQFTSFNGQIYIRSRK